MPSTPKDQQDPEGSPSTMPVPPAQRGTPSPEPPAPAVARQTPESFTFTAVARLELDDLLEQLIDRAGEVLRTQGRLRGLLRATQSISFGLDLPVLLQRIVDEARDLLGARYAALGVVAPDGTLAQFVHSGMDEQTVRTIGHLPEGKGLLGQLIADPHPLRLADLSQHSSSVGFPAAHPPMRSFLGVPVTIRGRVFGNLYLAEKVDGDEFASDDEELAEALAAAAAAAIDNATLYETITRRQRWLNASRALTNALLDVKDRDAGLDLVAQAAREVADADVSFVAVQERTGDIGVVASTGDMAERLRGIRIDDGSAIARATQDRSAILIDEEREAEGGAVHALRDLGIGPAAVVALSNRDEALGALVIGNVPGGRSFDVDELSSLSDFAHQAALVLVDSAGRAARNQLAMSDERARIARDLHDHSIQSIFAVGLTLNGLAARLPDSDAATVMELVDRLDEAIRSIRGTIFTLRRPSEAVVGSLRSLVAGLATELTQGLGFSPAVQLSDDIDRMVAPELYTDIAAVVRESLANVARHAHASATWICVTADDVLSVRVEDDGEGIHGRLRSSGIANLEERARRRGGRCRLLDRQGGGTVVEWIVPLGRPPSSAQPGTV